MTENELQENFGMWTGEKKLSHFSCTPFANMDVFEDENYLVNRLFYVVPDTSSGQLICFFYFAENLFTKDGHGDLTLIKSSFHRFYP